MKRFDVMVVGTGQAGQPAAARCAQAGLATAIVDRLPYGGTCALRGCDPKRAMLASPEAVGAVRRLLGNGPVGDVHIDWGDLQRFKRTFTDGVPGETEKWLAGEGVATLHGTARFTAPDRMAVDDEEFEFGDAVIATGAWPAPLGVPGQEHAVLSDGFMDLFELPKRIVFIGGGYVSFEFAHLAAAAGAECTIVHRGPAALAGFDADLAAAVVESYRAAGIDVVLDAPVTALRRDGSRTVVEAGGRELACDLAVHGAGRAPDLAALDLAAGQVAAGPHGVEVDEQLRSTTNPHVFACGDAAAKGLPLTPVASRQGKLVARVITGDASAVWGDPVTPTVVFSGPPLASVGLTEKAARDAGLDVDVHLNDTSTWYTSRRVGFKRSAAKTITEKRTRRIVGAHFFSPDAQELVNAVAAAMSAALTADQLIDLPLTYPTAAMDLEFLF